MKADHSILPLYQGRRVPYPGEEEIAKLVEIARGDGKGAAAQYAKEILIFSNLGLVISAARRYNARIPLEDLIEEGILGIVRGIKKFDSKKGMKFRNYICWWIRNGIKRATNNQQSTVRVPIYKLERAGRISKVIAEYFNKYGRDPTIPEISKKLEIPEESIKKTLNEALNSGTISLDYQLERSSSVHEFVPDEKTKKPEEAQSSEDLKRMIEQSLATLTSREEYVIRLRYNIGNKYAKEQTLEQIRTELNLTKERVRQIEAGALRKLRKPCIMKKIEKYL